MQKPKYRDGVSSKQRIADLYCGAGLSGLGLHRAGFEVVGFDIVFQKNYPFEFHQQDALTVDLSDFDAVWASPPCQAYSIMRNLPWLRDKTYPELIAPTREMLKKSQLPYVIENVMGAVTKNAIEGGWLCGGMFGLPFYRHRVFETNWFWMQPGHPNHRLVISAGRMLGNRERNTQERLGLFANDGNSTLSVGDTITGLQVHETTLFNAMTKRELSQAIPFVYSEYLGKHLIEMIS